MQAPAQRTSNLQQLERSRRRSAAVPRGARSASLRNAQPAASTCGHVRRAALVAPQMPCLCRSDHRDVCTRRGEVSTAGTASLLLTSCKSQRQQLDACCKGVPCEEAKGVDILRTSSRFRHCCAYHAMAAGVPRDQHRSRSNLAPGHKPAEVPQQYVKGCLARIWKQCSISKAYSPNSTAMNNDPRHQR